MSLGQSLANTHGMSLGQSLANTHKNTNPHKNSNENFEESKVFSDLGLTPYVNTSKASYVHCNTIGGEYSRHKASDAYTESSSQKKSSIHCNAIGGNGNHLSNTGSYIYSLGRNEKSTEGMLEAPGGGSNLQYKSSNVNSPNIGAHSNFSSQIYKSEYGSAIEKNDPKQLFGSYVSSNMAIPQYSG